MEGKHLKKTIEKYSKAIRANLGDTSAYLERGKAYCKLGQCDKSSRNFNEAIWFDPEDGYAYFTRGLAYWYDLGRIERGIEDLDEVIKLDPFDGKAYVVRGIACCDLGQFERGIEDFESDMR